MKILIPNATSPQNIGDEAILYSQVRLLEEIFDKPEIIIHSTAPNLQEKLWKYKVKPSISDLIAFKSRKTLVQIRQFIEWIFVLIIVKLRLNDWIRFNTEIQETLDDYRYADITLFVGNGAYRSQKGIKQSVYLFITLLPLFFSKLLSKATLVGPVSFGPFAYAWQAKLTALALSGVQSIQSRESISFRKMKSVGLKNLTQGQDTALFLNRLSNPKISKSLTVGLTVRNWFTYIDQTTFENTLVDGLVQFAKEKEIIIQPYVQVHAPEHGDHDLEVATRVSLMLSQSGASVKSPIIIKDLKHAIKEFSCLWFMVGMRMHSNIIAATQGIPFVALEYEYKTLGIARSLDMQSFVVDCSDMDSKNLYDKLMKAHEFREMLSQKLLKKIKTINVVQKLNWKKILRQATSSSYLEPLNDEHRYPKVISENLTTS